MAKDPVCGMAVDIAEAKRHGLFYVYDYREYAFCGAACRDRFLARPVAYAIAA